MLRADHFAREWYSWDACEAGFRSHAPPSAVARVPGSEPCPCHAPIFLQIIETELRSRKRWELTTEGEEIAQEGSHEARVFAASPRGPAPE